MRIGPLGRHTGCPGRTQEVGEGGKYKKAGKGGSFRGRQRGAGCLGEALWIARECGHTSPCYTADVYVEGKRDIVRGNLHGLFYFYTELTFYILWDLPAGQRSCHLEIHKDCERWPVKERKD